MIKGVFFRLFFLLFAFCSFASIASASTLTKAPSNLGLVGYWPFNEGSGSTAYDHSGNGNNGTLGNSPTWVAGPSSSYGKALSFNGGSQYVTVPDSPSLDPSQITMSVWVYRGHETSAYTYPLLITKEDFSALKGYNFGNFGHNYPTLDEPYCARINAGIPGDICETSATFNQWVFYVVTIDSSGNYNLYKNGILNASAVKTAVSIGNDSGPLVLGVNSPSTSLDDVRIYNRVLSAAEVAVLYNTGSVTMNHPNAGAGGSLTQGLVGYWSMDGSTISGTTVADQSGNGNNGSLNNSPTPVQGKIGQALSFNGTNQSVSSSITITATSTLCLWAKQSAYAGDDGYPNLILGPNGGIVDSSGHFIYYGGTFSSYTIPLNTWTHVCYVYDSNGETSLYVNGAYTDQGLTTNHSTGTTSGAVCIAAAYCPNVSNFPGSLDDVRIYNRALSAAEVTQLYNQGAGTHTNISHAGSGTLGQGLVGYWTMDGNTLNWNTGTMADSSGQGNTGHLVGMSTSTSPVAGKLGQALKFGGSSQYATLNDSATIKDQSLGDSITISAWAKRSATGVWSPIVTKDESSAPGGFSSKRNFELVFSGSGLNATTDSIAFFFRNNADTTWSGYSSNSTYTDSNWHNYIFTYTYGTSGSAHLYVDGSEVSASWKDGSGSATPANTSNGPLFIGLSQSNERYSGSLDDVRIYNRALSASEVQQLYNMGK